MWSRQRKILGCSKQGRWTERVAPKGKIKHVEDFGRMFLDQIFPAGAREFCLLQNIEDSTGVQTATCAWIARLSASGVKVKNKWSEVSTPNICLHGLQWDYIFITDTFCWQNAESLNAKHFAEWWIKWRTKEDTRYILSPYSRACIAQSVKWMATRCPTAHSAVYEMDIEEMSRKLNMAHHWAKSRAK